MSPREERAIRNEELFRDVNTHIARLEERYRVLDQDDPLPLVCECSQTGCSFSLQVPPAVFKAAREHPLRFFVAPGHEDPDVEWVVEDRGSYLIVQKHTV